MSNAFDNQVDGDHYTKMAMQPIELAYLVGGTPCFCKLAKYATRIKGERQINLDKAIHCIELERTLMQNSTYMVRENYPSMTNAAKHDQAMLLIDFFTKDPLIRVALKHMYNSSYLDAVEAIKQLKERISGEQY